MVYLTFAGLLICFTEMEIKVEIESSYPHEVEKAERVLVKVARDHELIIHPVVDEDRSKDFIEGVDLTEMLLSGVISVTLGLLANTIVKILKKDKKEDSISVIERTREIEIIDLESGTRVRLKESERKETKG